MTLRSALLWTAGTAALCGAVGGCGDAGDHRSDLAAGDTALLVAAPPPLIPLDTAKRYALLVGIATYPKATHTLAAPLNDLDSVRTFLVRRLGIPRERVLELRNAEATRDSIIWGFRNHLSKAGPTGMAFFYFSGHGLALDRSYSTDDEARDQSLYVWGRNRRAAMLLDDEINVLIRDLTAARIVVLMDACYSGSLVKGRGLIPMAALEQKGSVMLSARSEAQHPGSTNVMEVDGELDEKKSLIFRPPSDPAPVPAPPISEGQDLAAIDSLPLVFISAAQEGEIAWGQLTWAPSQDAGSVFTHYLNDTLRVTAGSRSFQDLAEAVAAGIMTRPKCVRNTPSCQVPQIRGGLKTRRLDEVLGPLQ